MRRGHRPARRRRTRNGRAARLAVPLGIPMALGLALGIVIAMSGGHTTKIDQSGLGTPASPAASASAPANPSPDPASTAG